MTYTPTPEAIEAAARALYELEPWQIASYSNDTYAWKALTPGDRSNFYREATAALSAAYPLMVAQAKAEAWGEGYRQGKADHCDYSPTAEFCDITRDNPYRAATIEGNLDG